jgi:3-oxochol-4-en-24-oyl-CoA dehydrogenase
VTLANERVSLSEGGALWGQGPAASDLLDLIRDRGGLDDPVLRQRASQLYIEAEVLRLIRLRTVTAAIKSRPPGPETSVRKALADEHGQRIMALAKDWRDTTGCSPTPGRSGPSTEAGTTGTSFPGL